MKFTREVSSAATIRRVSGKVIVVGEQRYTETIALTPDGLVENFAPPPIEELAISVDTIKNGHQVLLRQLPNLRKISPYRGRQKWMSARDFKVYLKTLQRG